MTLQSLLFKVKKYRLRKFSKNYDKQELQKYFALQKNPKTMLINKGLYEYGYFNFTFLDNMLSLIV